jgi:hypothetical protein
MSTYDQILSINQNLSAQMLFAGNDVACATRCRADEGSILEHFTVKQGRDDACSVGIG